MHTILRDQDTPREDFIFIASRLSRLLIEHALTLFPYDNQDVVTPTGSTYHGTHQNIDVCLDNNALCPRIMVYICVLVRSLTDTVLYDTTALWCVDHACR
jgi:uracil phosphoribosyltransferase